MAKQPRSLRGQVVAITGAARGIGRATAAALVREGARVGIGDLDADLSCAAAKELGGAAAGFELNVVDRGSFERFLDEVESALGPIDVLVNNAGIMHLGPLAEEDEATTLRMIDVNLIGVLTGCRLILPRFAARNRGHVVNVASMLGKIGPAGGATYCATKHAVVGMTESLRGEYIDTPIDVSVVMPGIVHTDLGAGLAKPRGGFSVEPEDVAGAIVDALRTGRVDVYVPRTLAPIISLGSALPRRAREAVARALKADRVLSGANAEERAAYEAARGNRGPRSRAAGEPGASRAAGGQASALALRAASAATRRCARRSEVPGPPAGSGRPPQ